MVPSKQEMHAYRLEVDARRFAKALKLIADVNTEAESVEIDFDGGMLSVRLGVSEQRIPATGSWPEPLYFPSRFARALSERPILGSSLELFVEHDRLTVGGFSFPYTAEPAKESSKSPDDPRVAEAANILKKLHVSKETVAALVANANPEYASLWSGGYETMIDRIANAWKILGPLGVDPRDIRQAIEESVRYAFSASAGRKKE